MDPFTARLRTAAEAGILFGVKWGIVLVGLSMIGRYVAGDYEIVRGRSYNGQLAYEWMLRVQQQQQPPVPPRREP